MTKNHDRKWAFVLGGPKTRLHDILWLVHDGRNYGRSEAKEIIGEFERFSHVPAFVRRWLIEPERSH